MFSSTKPQEYLDNIAESIAQFLNSPQEVIDEKLDETIELYLKQVKLVYLIKYYLIQWVEATEEMKYIENISNEEMRESMMKYDYGQYNE